jgi:GTA TIM-barrel-like domain/Putative phage tail protein
MATLALAAAAGAVIAAGTFLLAPKPKIPGTEGPRLKDSKLTTSTEGATIQQLYGRMRLEGQIIWASQFKETSNTTTTTTETGGKGGSAPQSTQTNYNYSISLAIAFCQGSEKASLSRVWADGKELDLSLYTYRFYNGKLTQVADAHIESIEGAGNVPAYREVCYILFENLPLAAFGNRVPQITAELGVPIVTTDPDDIQNLGRSFTLIPATGESAYGTQQYNTTYTTGDSVYGTQEVTQPDNVHNINRAPDVVRSLNQLKRMQTNLDTIELVVSWFATDLRAGNCRVIPKVESNTRKLSPNEWAVESYTRASAEVVSYDVDGRPVFGGTPSDATVIELIQYIKNVMGKKVVFYPFIIADIPASNTLPNPYSNNAATAGQPAFPWRGRITQSPAYGYTGTVDKTAAAATQITSFFTGTEGYNRMITHYANLCVAAGGVDGFLIGSELIGLTTSRDALGSYPAVSRLVTLAGTVKGIVGSGCKVGYAADWSEFVHDLPSEGLWFHLDPLWANSNIDFVGVDNYLPMSDWRDGATHLDYNGVTGPVSEYDITYLKSQIEGGEYYDYYYANKAARDSQTRTPIVDTVYSKPWVYRRKDFRNWMANLHYNRPGGVESGSPTAWTAYMKPLYFTEFGCPAVNKGVNQPNVFYDPKSSESFFPYYSTGLRDDFIQRVYVETFLSYWRDHPIMNGSTPMTDINKMFIWTWDARPYPDYPARLNVWSDGDLWTYGHWLTGRIEAIPLARLVGYLCEKAGLTAAQYDVSGLYGPGALVRGFVADSITTIRELLNSLAAGHQFDAYESEGKIKFILRANTKKVAIGSDQLVVSPDDPVGITLTRGQETELPTSIKISFVDEMNDHQSATVDGKTAKGYSQNVEELKLPMLLYESYVRSLADAIVQQAWIERQRGKVNLPLSLLKLEPGDAIALPVGSRSVDARLTVMNTGEFRASEFHSFDLGMFALPASSEQSRIPALSDLFGAVQVEWLDLPLFTGQEALPWAPRIAANASPWPGEVSIYRQSPDLTYSLSTIHPFRNAIGRLEFPLYSGPTNRWDRANTLYVIFDYGALSSVSELTALEQVLALGVQNSSGEWEVIQFSTATLLAPNKYAVSNLIRGALGTEFAMRDPVAAGALVVLLEPAFLTPLNITNELVTVPINYKWGPSRYAYTDASYQTGSRYGFRSGLRPYSPADFHLDRLADTTLVVNWSRRTRFGGDTWEVAEVPLNEETEHYRLRIYSGATLKREVVTTVPFYSYAPADQITDFGALQLLLKVEVAQYGAAYGDYGVAKTETIYLRSSA